MDWVKKLATSIPYDLDSIYSTVGILFGGIEERSYSCTRISIFVARTLIIDKSDVGRFHLLDFGKADESSICLCDFFISCHGKIMEKSGRIKNVYRRAV